MYSSLRPSIARHTHLHLQAVTYFRIRGLKSGGETGLLQPELEYTYEFLLDIGTIRSLAIMEWRTSACE